MLQKARLEHVKPIHQLLMGFAREGVVLPRSLSDICSNLRDFLIWVENGDVVGCGALHIVWLDLAEIRSLAVAASAQDRGIGSKIVQACLDEAAALHVPRVFTLTFVPDFFAKRGFRRVAKEELPHKVWADCVSCVHFPDCNEVPLIIDIAGSGTAEAGAEG